MGLAVSFDILILFPYIITLYYIFLIQMGTHFMVYYFVGGAIVYKMLGT